MHLSVLQIYICGMRLAIGMFCNKIVKKKKTQLCPLVNAYIIKQSHERFCQKIFVLCLNRHHLVSGFKICHSFKGYDLKVHFSIILFL